MKQLNWILVLLVATVLSTSGCSEASKIAKDPLGYLTKNTWVLNSLMGSGIPDGLFPGGLPSLNFSPEGAVSGFTGCNNMTGGDFSADGSLSLDKMAMTRKACPGDGEQKFLSALNDVAAVNIDPGVLSLVDAGGVELLKFLPQE